MSKSTFQAGELPQENYSTYNLLDNLLHFEDDFDLSNDSPALLPEEDGFQEHFTTAQFGFCSSEENPLTSLPDEKIENHSLVTKSGEGSSSTISSTSFFLPVEGESWEKKKNRKDGVFTVAFRTKSAIDVMDDGFKWRKYGKKRVKNSPNPRNYYRCASVGCQVKKRVERDSKDASYVITTYVGTHDHQSPCVVYYNQTPFLVPCGWMLQASRDP